MIWRIEDSIFLEVLRDDISLLIDSDVGYYIYFKIGDIIEQNVKYVKLNGHPILYGDFSNSIVNYTIPAKTLGIQNKRITVRVSVFGLIKDNYFKDITKQIIRDIKLTNIGI